MREQRYFTLMATPIMLILIGHLVGATSFQAGGIKLRVTAEQANIRERPDIMSPILEQLPGGAILEAERKEGEWFAVLVERTEGGAVLGYVHESLVALVETRPAEPPREERILETEKIRERPIQKPVEPVEAEPRYVPPTPKQAPAGTFRGERPAVALWVGGRYAAVGDLNEGAEGLARYYAARLAAAAEGDDASLHYGYLVGAEARLPLAFGFHLAIGVEYGSGESAGSIVYNVNTQNVSLATKLTVRAVPISLALVYYPSPSFYLKAGVEYAFARCGYSYRLTGLDADSPADAWQEWTGRADSSGFGYLAGIGYDWSLTPALSLAVEVIYRNCRLGDLGGEDVYSESSSYESTEEGKLYYFRVDSGAAEAVPFVFVRERRPSEAGVIDARKAEFSLSGLSLKLGIKIRL